MNARLPVIAALVLAPVLALVAALGGAARAQDLAPEKSVDAPALPAPASRSGALWAALATCQKGAGATGGGAAAIALDEVLAASGYAFRATDCANDCPCIEWREEALAIAPAAHAFGWADSELDLAHADPETAFATLRREVDAGRAPFYAGPREVGVIHGYRVEPRTFFVHALVNGEKRDEARPAAALSELWELHTFTRTKTPALEDEALERRVLLAALAHARRAPVRGGCGFLEAPALNAWGLAALSMFADRLASFDHGIAGGHGAVAERAAHLRAGRAAAVAFLERAAKRRDAAKPGSGAPLADAAKSYRAELETALVPLEALTAGKDELALAPESVAKEAAALLAKAAEHERAALLAIEKDVLLDVAPNLRDALSLARTAPVPEKLVPELAALAAGADADLRVLAVVTLADAPGPAARAALARALLDQDGPVSEAALYALEGRNEEGLVDLLLDAWDKAQRTRLRSERPLQRQLVFSLADRATSDPRALRALERALEDQGEGDEVPDAIPRWAAASLYSVQGVEAEPALLAAMKSPRSTARRAAAAVLDLSGSKPALAALDAALADADASVRLTAAAALGRRGNEKGLKTALAALRDSSRDVRSLGVETLTRIGAPALPGVVKLLDDKDWRIRANACVVICRTGGTAELTKVAALEKDAAPAVRDLALQAKAVLEARARAEEKKK